MRDFIFGKSGFFWRPPIELNCVEATTANFKNSHTIRTILNNYINTIRYMRKKNELVD